MGAELVSKVHDLLTEVEQLHGQKQFNGDTDRLFTIVESCASKRPVSALRIGSYSGNGRCLGIGFLSDSFFYSDEANPLYIDIQLCQF